MPSVRQQQTIAGTASVEGFGYWSGSDVRVEFRPAPPDSGITFVRRDLGPSARIAAVVANRIEAERRTTLGSCGATVEMVEHVMAALAGLLIDNCEVWIDAPELPGCDGSAQAYVDALDRAGIVSQNFPRRRIIVERNVRFGQADRWIEIQPSRTGGLSIEFTLDYGIGTAIGKQSTTLSISPELFRREIAGSRTFLLEEEARWLVSRGMGKRVTARDLLIFGPDGPIDNELRFQDECVRHKVLDVIGDLAITGCDIAAHIVAHRSGHDLNGQVARWVLENQTSKSLPVSKHQERQCA
jgi:UDP-3-O-acyl N-acetylglucosamine deacetylase